MKPAPDSTRRMLLIAAGSMTGVGALAALWPFIDAMNPAADVRARRVIVDLASIKEGAELTIGWKGLPIIVSRRTSEQQVQLRHSVLRLRDPASLRSEQPLAARNWHRSLRADIGVLQGSCTRGDCIVSRKVDHYQCPCCGAAYDFAGRLFSGPAPRNLSVPPHRLVGEHLLEIGVA